MSFGVFNQNSTFQFSCVLGEGEEECGKDEQFQNARLLFIFTRNNVIHFSLFFKQPLLSGVFNKIRSSWFVRKQFRFVNFRSRVYSLLSG